MTANFVGPWIIFSLGGLADLSLAIAVVVARLHGRRSSTVPYVAIFFYLLFSLTRRMTGQLPLWPVSIGAILLHLVWHRIIVPTINRARG
jgi:uncharacterized membrane protein YhaH (DUF805 family)